MSKSVVLVTGIGGNVGYGILRNIRDEYPEINLVGTNTTKVSAGNHLCNKVFEVPFALDTAYIPKIKHICEVCGIDLIIPSTDYEGYILSQNRKLLPEIAISPEITCETFLDKYESFIQLREKGLHFAMSILPSDYKRQFPECILKPRKGRGSRGIEINPSDPKSFTDDYIVQPLLKGKEITTAFYVTRKNDLNGIITLERTLSSGATAICQTVFDYDTVLEEYIYRLIKVFSIRGSCNIQSIVTENGIIPFEINCRISGTNSIRSKFGFKDVKYTMQEYFYGLMPSSPIIEAGSAVRIMDDIIYPGIGIEQVNNKNDNFKIYT